MLFQARFGDEWLPVEIAESKVAGSFRGPGDQPIEDVSSAVREALDAPVDAPPLSRALVGGDRVAIVVDSGLPDCERILTPILEYLAQATSEPINALVVCDPGFSKERVAQLTEDLTGRFEPPAVFLHDPTDQAGHAYLASAQEGRRIYLNREAAEADAMIVVGPTGFDPIVGQRGAASAIFPALSNAETRQLSRQIAMDLRSSSAGLRRRQLCDEVGWLSGLFYAVSVALDRNNEVEQIWVGQFRTVQTLAEEQTQRDWTFQPPSKAPDLVIATVSPSSERATWTAVASALETASNLVSGDGKIALVADIADRLGETGNWLVDNDNPWEVLGRLRGSEASDIVSTAQLARALAANKIYLMSKLAPDFVESLSMIPVSSEREIERLAEQATSCWVIENADRVRMEEPPELQPVD